MSFGFYSYTVDTVKSSNICNIKNVNTKLWAIGKRKSTNFSNKIRNISLADEKIGQIKRNKKIILCYSRKLSKVLLICDSFIIFFKVLSYNFTIQNKQYALDASKDCVQHTGAVN